MPLYCECETPLFDPAHDAGCRRCGRMVDFTPTAPTYRCDNCGHRETDPPLASRLWERLDEGGTYTNVECSRCGALTYLEGAVSPKRWVAVTGTMGDGFRLYGTFDTAPEAAEWAERECREEWWVLELVGVPS